MQHEPNTSRVGAWADVLKSKARKESGRPYGRLWLLQIGRKREKVTNQLFGTRFGVHTLKHKLSSTHELINARPGVPHEGRKEKRTSSLPKFRWQALVHNELHKEVCIQLVRFGCLDEHVLIN